MKQPRIYSAEDIQQYLRGLCSAEEMHAIEKAALDDPLLADAIEGVQVSMQKREAGSLESELSELRRRLQDRVGHSANHRTIPLSRYWAGIAASLLVLAGAGLLGYHYFFINQEKASPIAGNNQKLILADSSSYKLADSAYPEEDSPKSQEIAISKTKLKKSLKPNTKRDTVSGKGYAFNLARIKEDSAETTMIKPSAPSQVVPIFSKAKDVEFSDKEKKRQPEPEALAGKSEISTSSEFEKDANKNFFKGRVIDANNKPVISASVFLKDLDMRAVTDMNGVFFIKLPKPPDSVANITINSPGYYTARAAIRKNDTAGNVIQLQAGGIFSTSMNNVDKSEITNVKKSAEDLIPYTGWTEYQHYLDRNKKITTADSILKGTEIISFELSGKKRFSSFIIEKSLSAAHDAEVIRLIKEGPSWILLKGKKARAIVSVTF